MKIELPNVDNIATGQAIKLQMDIHKMGAYDVSEILGLRSATNVYAWTSGRFLPNLDNLVKLARIFECRLDDLVVTKDELYETTSTVQRLY